MNLISLDYNVYELTGETWEQYKTLQETGASFDSIQKIEEDSDRFWNIENTIVEFHSKIINNELPGVKFLGRLYSSNHRA